MQVGDWVAMLVKELVDLRVEGGGALVEVIDVAGEVADAAGGDLLNEAVAEADSLSVGVARVGG